jgi:hypothetical protein
MTGACHYIQLTGWDGDFFFFSITGVWTQGLMLARRVLQLQLLHQPFFVRQGLLILLISASWVARITGVSHQHPAKVVFFIFGGIGVWTHSLELARQAPFLLEPLCQFEVGILISFCPGWPWTETLLSSAFRVAEIIYVRHHTLLVFIYLFLPIKPGKTSLTLSDNVIASWEYSRYTIFNLMITSHLENSAVKENFHWNIWFGQVNWVTLLSVALSFLA